MVLVKKSQLDEYTIVSCDISGWGTIFIDCVMTKIISNGDFKDGNKEKSCARHPYLKERESYCNFDQKKGTQHRAGNL